jgi:Surface antigen variable number repeat
LGLGVRAGRSTVYGKRYNRAMRHGLGMSVVFGLACAVICPAQGWAQLAESEIEEPGFCRASPPWVGRHVLGGVTVGGLKFDGKLHLSPRDQREIVSSIEQQSYFGNPDNVAAGILEQVKRAWMDRGYFKVRVDGDIRILADDPLSTRIALAVHVDEGQQYRLRRITFNGNRAIRNLRNLFPLQDGDLFKLADVAQGLDNLRMAYRSLGFINFTSIPNTEIDEESGTILLAVDLDEGKQFVVSDIKIEGLDEPASENVLKDLALKPGEPYDEGLAELFLLTDGSLLPAGDRPDSRIHMALNERAGTVAIAFDFRPCAVE